MSPSRIASVLCLTALLGCGGGDTVTSLATSGTGVVISPKSVTLVPGASALFTATVIGNSNHAVTWSVGGTGSGSFASGTGVYTAPVTPGTYTLVATSVADSSKADSASVTVSKPLEVSVAPATVQLPAGGLQTFTATVTGSSHQGVTWGTIGGGAFTGTSGLYTAPQAPGSYVVTATSVVDPGRIGTAAVTVTGTGAVKITPASASVLPGGTQQFSATVGGGTATPVDWSVLEPLGGSISAGGLYTAPAAPGSFTVKATSRADGLTFATASVLITPITVTLVPAALTLDQGATQFFTPVITGTSETLLAWSIDGGAPVRQAGPYLYVAPSASGAHLLRAALVSAPAAAGSASIAVSPVVISDLSPSAAVVKVGGTMAFTATVSGTVNRAVTWSLLPGGAGGTLNSAGFYTAPSSAGSDFVVATAAGDARITRTALVTVGSIVISPSAPPIVPNTVGRLFFSATVTGVPDPGVTWSILPVANGGNITPAGYFFAPTQPGTYRIRATSVFNPALFSEVQVTVS